MTITDTAGTATDVYRDAVATCSAADRAFAGDVTQHLIEVVKAFGAVKHRMHGATPQDGFDYGLLLKLASTGPTRASDLAERLCADPSTVSRQVAGLVKAGLVQRLADPDDGRASILVPTADGHARIAQMVEMRGRVFAPLVADWSLEDRERFATLLAQFVQGLSHNIEAVKTVAAELLQPAPATEKSTAQGSNA